MKSSNYVFFALKSFPAYCLYHEKKYILYQKINEESVQCLIAVLMIHILLMTIFPSGSLHLTDKSDLHLEEIPVIAIPDPAPHHQRRGPHRHQEGSHQNCQQDPLGLSACECIYKQEDENTEWHLLYQCKSLFYFL